MRSRFPVRRGASAGLADRPPPCSIQQRCSVKISLRFACRARVRVVEQAFRPSADRIARQCLHGFANGKFALGAQRKTRRLGEAFVQAEPASARNVRPHGVEHLPPLLIGIASFVEKRAKEAAALRFAERVGIARRDGGLRRVPHPRGHVAKREHARAGHRRIGDPVRELIGASRLKAAGHGDGVAFDLPLLARDGFGMAEHAVANGER